MVSDEIVEMALDTFDESCASRTPEQPAAKVSWIGYTRAQRLAVMRRFLEAAIPNLHLQGDAVGRLVYYTNKHGHGEWEFMPATLAYDVLKATPKIGGQYADQRFDVYAAIGQHPKESSNGN